MNVLGRRAVLARVIIGIRRKSAQAVGAAARVIEGIKAEQRNILVQPRIDVGDQLILVIEARRFHQEDRIGRAEREDAASRYAELKGARQRRVYVGGAQHVDAVGIGISDGDGSMVRQLALDAGGRLHQIWRVQPRTDFLNALRRL